MQTDADQDSYRASVRVRWVLGSRGHYDEPAVHLAGGGEGVVDGSELAEVEMDQLNVLLRLVGSRRSS